MKKEISDGQIYQEVSHRAFDPRFLEEVDLELDRVMNRSAFDTAKRAGYTGSFEEWHNALSKPAEARLKEQLEMSKDQSELNRDFFNIWTTPKQSPIPMNNLCAEIIDPLSTDRQMALAHEVYLSEQKRPVSIPVARNLCKEIPLSSANECMIAYEFLVTEELLKAKYNWWTHVSIALRQEFAPTGKLIRSSFSGYSAKDFPENHKDVLRNFLREYYIEHEELNMAQLETLYYALGYIRSFQQSLGQPLDRLRSFYMENYFRHHHGDGKLPERYVNWINKKVPLFDTECNSFQTDPILKWSNEDFDDIVLNGGFELGKVPFLTCDSLTPLKTSAYLQQAKRIMDDGEIITGYDIEANVFDKNPIVKEIIQGKEMNEQAKIDQLVAGAERVDNNSVFGAIASAQDGGFKRDELPLVSSQTDPHLGYKMTDRNGAMGVVSEIDGKTKAEQQYDALGGPATFPSKRRKKGKGAKRSKHITNCKKGITHAIMGMTILAKLGQRQQQFQDNAKREILKNHTLSSFVETVSGEAIPEYQKRLLDLNQRRNDDPTYEPDDGPLTDTQIEAIRDASPATNIPAENFSQRLFEEPVNEQAQEESDVRVEEGR